MKFRFKADVTFTAVDLDTAFARLKEHFQSLAEGAESPLEFRGEFILVEEKS